MSIAEMKTCWLPLTEERDPGPFASQYFGTPWLAEGEKWPESDGERLRAVLQLRVDSLPAPMAALLGGTGLVQFFYPSDDSSAETWYGKGGLLRLVRPEGMPAVSPAPLMMHDPAVLPHLKNPPKGHVAQAITGWREHPDFPHSEETLRPDGDEANNGNEDDDGPSGCVQGDKLGGWPFWTQACERLVQTKDGTVQFFDDIEASRNTETYLKENELLVPFFQIDAGCFFAAGAHGNAFAPDLFASDGTLHLSVLPSDPTVMEWRWACT